MKKKILPRLRAYPIVVRAIEEGIAYGLRRLNKYREHPYSDEALAAIADYVEREALNALCDVIDFGDEENSKRER